MQIGSKIRFYLTIGCIAALLTFLFTDEESVITIFSVSAAVYFMLGLFLGGRIEPQIILASFFVLFPLIVLLAHSIFFNTDFLPVNYVYGIAPITCFIGFVISKFWNSKYKLIKPILVVLLIMSIFSYYMIYNTVLS